MYNLLKYVRSCGFDVYSINDEFIQEVYEVAILGVTYPVTSKKVHISKKINGVEHFLYSRGTPEWPQYRIELYLSETIMGTNELKKLVKKMEVQATKFKTCREYLNDRTIATN